MNDATSRKLLVSALHSLLTFIQYCVRENFNFRDKNKRYYVGQLELPLWLVEKYSSKETPVST
jgi:hypothetical protein